MSAVTTEGAEVLCGAMAEYCRCAKPAGHVAAGDVVHGCDPTECTAEWVGDYRSGDWKPVTMPSPVRR